MNDSRLTVEQAIEYHTQDLLGYISDVSKEACGCRIRSNPDQDFASLEADADSWTRAAHIAFEEQEQDELVAALKFEALVADTMATGAGDRATALRWLEDAEGDSYSDMPGYMEYTYGLKYGYLGART